MNLNGAETQPNPASMDPRVVAASAVAAHAHALKVLPAVLELLETSPLHYLHGVEFLFNRIFPSLLNGQFRLLVKEGKPVAFVNWAWLSDAVSEKFSHYGHQLGPTDWRGGDNLWFVEIVARDGMMQPLIRDLQHAVFTPGTRGRWVRVGPSGELKGVGEIRMPGPPTTPPIASTVLP